MWLVWLEREAGTTGRGSSKVVTIVKVFVHTYGQGVKEVHHSVFLYMCLINVCL